MERNFGSFVQSVYCIVVVDADVVVVAVGVDVVGFRVGLRMLLLSRQTFFFFVFLFALDDMMDVLTVGRHQPSPEFSFCAMVEGLILERPRRFSKGYVNPTVLFFLLPFVFKHRKTKLS